MYAAYAAEGTTHYEVKGVLTMFQVTFVFDSRADSFWESYIGRQCKLLAALRGCVSFKAEETDTCSGNGSKLTVERLVHLIRKKKGIQLNLHDVEKGEIQVPAGAKELPLHVAETVVSHVELSCPETASGKVLVTVYPKSA